MTANPLHSSLSNEHYSPASIVTPARAVLEHIDFDPASCEFANRLVQAHAYAKQNDNGLTQAWDFPLGNPSRVFLNPPGGKYDRHGNRVEKGPGRSSAAMWWAKLIEEWEAGRVHSAIFVCFSLNVFRTAQSESNRAPYEFPFVVCGDRVRYDKRGPNDERIPGNAPQQDSAIAYVPERNEYADLRGENRGVHKGCDLFEQHFSPLGSVRL